MHALKHSPIGIFDSGLGGLSVTKCITQLLPRESIIYIADHLKAPYGELGEQAIIERVNLIADHLVAQGVKAIVLACNTATVSAIHQLREKIQIPIIGVEPGIKPAALASNNKKVGILVTQATSKNEKFTQLVNEHSNGCQVYTQACPGLVNLIESGLNDKLETKALLERFISPLIEQNVDTVVLGCTHYPFIKDQLQTLAGEHINIIETSEPVTRQLIRTLSVKQMLAEPKFQPTRSFYSTNLTDKVSAVASQLWQEKLLIESLDL